MKALDDLLAVLAIDPYSVKCPRCSKEPRLVCGRRFSGEAVAHRERAACAKEQARTALVHLLCTCSQWCRRDPDSLVHTNECECRACGQEGL